MISCVRTKRWGWQSGVVNACAIADESLASFPCGESPSFWEMASLSDVGAAARKSWIVAVPGPAAPPQTAGAAPAKGEKKRKNLHFVSPRKRPAAPHPGAAAGLRAR